MGLTPTKTDFTVLEDRSWLGSAHGADSTFSMTVDGDSIRTRFAAGSYLPSGVVVARDSVTEKGVLYAGTSDEVQTVTVTGAPTGGTFTLTFAGQTTAGITFNATAAAVKAALVALNNIGPDDVNVAGAAGGPFTVSFVGALADTDVAALTASGAGLTGGSTPGVTIATTTAGGADLGVSGSGVAKGHVFSGKKVPATGDLHLAILDHGKVIVANLPAGHGLDAAARADLTHVRYVL